MTFLKGDPSGNANSNVLNPGLVSSHPDYRITYIVLFSIFLVFALVGTLLIYYCIRYKKKYFFDASGRKFIVSRGEQANQINMLKEIIQFDNKQLLEEEVIKNSIAIFHLTNEKGQNLLHQCAFHGAKDCLLYIIKFELINPNEKDDEGNIPLHYLLTLHCEDLRKNREMFLWMCSVTKMDNFYIEDKKYIDSLNEWQTYIYKKYVKNAFLRQYIMTDPSV